MMNLKELVEQPDHEVISQEEAVFIIKSYIKIRKGRDVDFEPEFRLGQIAASLELGMLLRATNHAIGWLRNNKEEMEKLNN